MRLADGTALTVIYGEDNREKAWDRAEGRTLVLRFDADLGTVLVDAESGLALPVVDDLGERHPITFADSECQMHDSSTMGIKGCLGEASGRWDRQLNLNYQRLLATLDAGKQAIRLGQLAAD